jgi:hypothetical protein
MVSMVIGVVVVVDGIASGVTFNTTCCGVVFSTTTSEEEEEEEEAAMLLLGDEGMFENFEIFQV